MSLKGTNTTSDYLNFDEVTLKALRIIKQGKDANLGFLVIVGINMGLRISDILKLKFEDFENDTIQIIEKKTKKKRLIKVNDNVKEALDILKKVDILSKGLIFISKSGSVYSIQYINRWLKSKMGAKKIKVSSHSLRKTFGRRVWQNNNESEKALLYLSQLFQHSNLQITSRYLGIRQEELDDIYMSL
jgi:integrase